MSEDALGTRVSGGNLLKGCQSESDDVGWVGVRLGLEIEIKLAASSTRVCRKRGGRGPCRNLKFHALLTEGADGLALVNLVLE